ncbi:uncharacterized protein LOC126899953 isoform X2 [Daktulosphaira vitifoliae]|uniref:uncharacterized protein LOC126899953 isoform X2 n=1 Tax=Daktulosphaira vitifoliae TaxID=58002 RepID=UPI0021AAC2AC|nr:uncharacterized protein LOC126899953 isoform X2 [Daktulosphaira vitifoliae]
MNSTTNINNNQEYQINILRNGIKNIDITENKNKSIEDISHDIQNLHIVMSLKNQNENLDSYTVCSLLTEQVLRTYNLTLCNKKYNNSDKYSKIKKEKSKVKKKSSLEVFNMTQE